MAAVLLLADKPAHIGSGAVLTLALPLGFTLLALCVLWFMVRRSGRAREPVELAGSDAAPASSPGPE